MEFGFPVSWLFACRVSDLNFGFFCMLGVFRMRQFDHCTHGTMVATVHGKNISINACLLVVLLFNVKCVVTIGSDIAARADNMRCLSDRQDEKQILKAIS